MSKGLLSSIYYMSSIEDTFQPYVHSGTIRQFISPPLQACSPSLETYQLSRVLDDSDWVYSRWRLKSRRLGFFRLFWYSKKGICDAFCDAFVTRSPFPWKTHLTHPTLPTLMNMTLTPHSRHTYLYHHLVAVGSVDFTTDTFRPTLRSVDCLIGF